MKTHTYLLYLALVLVTASATAGMILDEDFESYTLGAQIPPGSNWTYYNCPTDNGLIADTQSVSPTKSLHFDFDGNEEVMITWSPSLGLSLASGTIEFSFYFDPAEANQWLYFIQQAKNPAGSVFPICELRFSSKTGIYDYPNGYYYSNYHWFSSISKGVWHHVKFEFNHPTHSYDLYFDEVLIGDDVAYYDGDSSALTTGFKLGDGETSTYYNLDVYLDDISVEGEGHAAVDIAVTDKGVELAFELNTPPGSVADIQWADNVEGSWHTAANVETGESSGSFDFTVLEYGGLMFSAIGCSNGIVYGSNYQESQFYEYNLATQEHYVRGNPCPIGGIQIYTVIEYSPTKIYFASYTDATLIAYDPTQPWVTVNGKAQPSGTNPLWIGRVGDEQNRPIDGVLGPDGYIYIANYPDYGKIGGALTKLNPTTDTWVNYRNIVDTQSLCTISIIEDDNRYIAGGTVGEAQGYAYLLGPAKLYLWDTWTDTVVYAEKPPVGEDLREVSQLESTEDGKLIGLGSDGVNSLYLFVFDPVSRTFLHTQNITSIVGRLYIIGNLTKPYQGYVYFTAHNGNICRINTTTYAVEVAATHPDAFKGGSLATDPLNGNKTYYLVMTKTELMAMTLDAPMYQFTNFGRMVDQPIQGFPVYGPGANGVWDTIYMSFTNYYKSWILVALDSVTGEYTQYIAPDASNAYYVNGHVIGSDGKLYVTTSKGGKLFSFDPKNPGEGIVDLGVVCPGETYLYELRLGTDGNLYMGSYPHAKLLSYNIASGTFIDYGQVSGDEMYVRYIAPYNEHYAYARVGPVNRRLFRVDLLTHVKE